MSQQSHQAQQTLLTNNKSIHLSKNNNNKHQLYRKIDIYLSQLEGKVENQEKIEVLKMRKKLIQKYGLSVERIDNLERIFLHYCSHIFKTGKHMTFQRLEYEKNHLTMDRFFVFLKDFSLTTASIDGVAREIVDKNQLVLIFKKMSINCKDLNFQQFISCIQKIAIVYYDAKTTYKSRQQKLARERQKRKQNYIKSMKRRQAAMEAAKSKLQGTGKDEDEQNRLINHQGSNFDEQNNNEQIKVTNQEQEKSNEKLDEQLINSKDAEHPEEQIKEQENKDTKQIEANEIQNRNEDCQSINYNAEREDFDRDELLVLTPQEKIEYFYELIDVDNALSFKKKMRELNLPLFQPKSNHRRATSHLNTNPAPIVKESKMPEITPEEQKRLDELRLIMEQKKERDRGSIPHMNREDYEERRKKRIHEQQQVHVKRLPRQKKIQVSELETDLSSLSKMEFDKINFRKFNPQKLYEPSQEDDAYLEEYYSVRKPQRSEKRIMSTLDTTDKYSQVLLQKLKKRTQEIQSRERMQQSKYSVDQEVNASAEHQLRKNRLLQKLLKLQKS